MIAIEASLLIMTVYPIRKSFLAVLAQEKALTKVPMNMSDFADNFLPDIVMELWNSTRINEQAIKLVEGKLFPYGLIYSLSRIESETLKRYIET